MKYEHGVLETSFAGIIPVSVVHRRLKLFIITPLLAISFACVS